MQASPHQSCSAPNLLSMSLWNLLCPVVWSHFEAGRGHLETIPTKHEIVQNILVSWSIKNSIYWKWPSPPKKTKQKKQPSSMKLYTWNNAVWQILLSWHWQNHACPLDCQMEKLDSSLQWISCVLYTTALLGILLVKPLWPMYVGESYPWDEQVFFFNLRVWLGLECTGMPGLEKLSWISLINLLQQGWQCCSICYSVSPWLISDLLSCEFKSFLYVCVSFLSVLPKRECVLPRV